MALITKFKSGLKRLSPRGVWATALVPDCAREGATAWCDFNDLLTLVSKLFNYFVLLAAPLAAAIIVYGGIVMVTSGTNESKRTEAKGIIGNAVLGLIIVLAAWLVVRTIMVGLKVVPSFIPNFF